MFTFFISFIMLQRIVELVIAKRNEKWMVSQGGIEVGQSHYRLMVTIHVLFFLVFMLEVSMLKKEASPIWPLLFPLFIGTQIGRIWVIKSLGKYWNTKIIILPKGKVVKKGPYRFLKHPNYMIVTLEFLIIPLMFQAFATAVLFTILNVFILTIRIPAEEKALLDLTEYGEAFSKQKRFIPTISKRI
jgi:methyltransferase